MNSKDTTKYVSSSHCAPSRITRTHNLPQSGGISMINKNNANAPTAKRTRNLSRKQRTRTSAHNEPVPTRTARTLPRPCAKHIRTLSHSTHDHAQGPNYDSASVFSRTTSPRPPARYSRKHCPKNRPRYRVQRIRTLAYSAPASLLR
eukprot:IDg15153t1